MCSGGLGSSRVVHVPEIAAAVHVLDCGLGAHVLGMVLCVDARVDGVIVQEAEQDVQRSGEDRATERSKGGNATRTEFFFIFSLDPVARVSLALFFFFGS